MGRGGEGKTAGGGAAPGRLGGLGHAYTLPSGARAQVGGKAGDKKPIFEAVRITPHVVAEAGGRLCIGVDGSWYDVTGYVDHHPGGDIIKEFIGQDATSVFHAWHPPHILGKRRKCGAYDSKCKDPVELAYRQLQKRAQEEGWYDTDMFWFAEKVAAIILFYAASIMLVIWGQTAPLRTYVAAVIMAAAWQQCGFLMHDFMHAQIFHDRNIDHMLVRFLHVYGLVLHAGPTSISSARLCPC